MPDYHFPFWKVVKCPYTATSSSSTWYQQELVIERPKATTSHRWGRLWLSAEEAGYVLGLGELLKGGPLDRFNYWELLAERFPFIRGQQSRVLHSAGMEPNGPPQVFMDFSLDVGREFPQDAMILAGEPDWAND